MLKINELLLGDVAVHLLQNSQPFADLSSLPELYTPDVLRSRELPEIYSLSSCYAQIYQRISHLVL